MPINKSLKILFDKWKKWLKYIALSAFAGLIIAVVLTSLLIKPKYEASSMYYVSVILLDEEKELGYNEFLSSTELAGSFLLYISDTYMFKLAAKNLPAELADKYTYRDLQSMIKAELIPETFIIRVRVTANNIEDAVILSNFYSEFALNEVKTMIGLGYTELLERATEDNVRTKNKTVIYAIAGAVAGAAVMCLAIFIKMRLSEKIKSAEDIRRAFPELSILGEVAYEKGGPDDL